MPCKCCFCKSAFPCAACTDGTPKVLFASLSGITPKPSGVCVNATSGTGGIGSAFLCWSSVQDASGCMVNSSGFPCLWTKSFFAGGPDAPLVGPGSGSSPCNANIFTAANVYSSAGCSAGHLGGGVFDQIVFAMEMSGGVWTFTAFITNAFIGGPTNVSSVLFQGSTPVSPVLCKGVSLTFSNNVTLGAPYAVPASFASGTGGFGLGMATGGSATVGFNKSCC